MGKCGVLFEVRTEFLNNIYPRIGFKGLRGIQLKQTYKKLVVAHLKALSSQLHGGTEITTKHVRTDGLRADIPTLEV
jgi:hypothetical protein